MEVTEVSASVRELVAAELEKVAEKLREESRVWKRNHQRYMQEGTSWAARAVDEHVKRYREESVEDGTWK